MNSSSSNSAGNSTGNSASSSSSATPPAPHEDGSFIPLEPVSSSRVAQYVFMEEVYAYGSNSSLLSPTMTSSTDASSTISSTSSKATGKKKNNSNSNNKNGNVNVYTTCGRHSNEWLFSGWSVFRRRDQ